MPIRKLQQTSGTDEIQAKKHNRCVCVCIHRWVWGEESDPPPTKSHGRKQNTRTGINGISNRMSMMMERRDGSNRNPIQLAVWLYNSYTNQSQ
jgi:hypothetical protein